MINRSLVRVALVVALVSALALVPAALAGKPSGKGRGKTTMTGTLNLVLVNSPDAVANYGESVKFDVVTNAPWPFVDLDCWQGGSLVYHSTVGYYGGWPWGDTFTLSGWAWPGGEADCTAKLYNDDGSTSTTITTLNFHVYA